MPFPRKPAGFSTETLGLLDVAMTKLWLEQVAIGASLGNADPTLRASLRDQMGRLNELGTSRRVKRRRKGER